MIQYTIELTEEEMQLQEELFEMWDTLLAKGIDNEENK